MGRRRCIGVLACWLMARRQGCLGVADSDFMNVLWAATVSQSTKNRNMEASSTSVPQYARCEPGCSRTVFTVSIQMEPSELVAS